MNAETPSEALARQPTPRPTRKVTAATIGAAVGATCASLARSASTQSVWLEWLATPEVQFLLTVLGAGVGAGLAGYLVRERAP